MDNDPNQISREAWDANAKVWDARMGDEATTFLISLESLLGLPARARILIPESAIM